MRAPGEAVRRVSALWRFPVKSMSGERLAEAEVTRDGLVGDRAFALIDAETQRVVSAKNTRHYPGLLECAAAYVDAPVSGRALPALRITLPNGASVTGAPHEADRALSAHFGREVRLARAAPAGAAADASWHGSTAPPPLAAHYFEEIGVAPFGPPSAFVDLYPVSVLTTATLARLAELEPRSRWDARRFRMNVIVAGGEPGFPENDWVGREVSLGDAVRLRVALRDSRCALTTLAQGDLPADPEVLKALVRHNRAPVGAGGLYPCAGVYATVAAAGLLRIGDRVAV